MKSLNRIVSLVILAGSVACGDGGGTENGTKVNDTTPPTASASPEGSASACTAAGAKWFTADVTVAMSSSEAGVIRYTVDGADPLTAASAKELPGPLELKLEGATSDPTTVYQLRFVAKDKAGNKSTEVSFYYCIDKKRPFVRADPVGGLRRSATSAVNVTLRTDEKLQFIKYTVDGSDPKSGGGSVTSVPNYSYGVAGSISTPVTLNATENTTIKFYGVDIAGNESISKTEKYNFIDEDPSIRGTLHIGPKYVGKDVWLFVITATTAQTQQGPRIVPDMRLEFLAGTRYKISSSFNRLVKKFLNVSEGATDFFIPFDGDSDYGKDVFVMAAVDMATTGTDHGRIDEDCVPAQGGGLSCSGGPDPYFYLDPYPVHIGDPASLSFDPATEWNITGVEGYLDAKNPSKVHLGGTVYRSGPEYDQLTVFVFNFQGYGQDLPIVFTGGASDLEEHWEILNMKPGDYYATLITDPSVFGAGVLYLEDLINSMIWGGFGSVYTLEVVGGTGDDRTQDANFYLGVKGPPGTGSIAGTLTFTKEMPAGSYALITAYSDTNTDSGEFDGDPLVNHRVKILSPTTTLNYLIGGLNPLGQYGLGLPWAVGAGIEMSGAKTPRALQPRYGKTGSVAYTPLELDAVTDATGANMTVAVSKLTGTITADGASDKVGTDADGNLGGNIQINLVADGGSEQLTVVRMGLDASGAYTVLGVPSGTFSFSARADMCGNTAGGQNDINFFNDPGDFDFDSWQSTSDGINDLTAHNLSVSYTSRPACQ